jgi:hypothetical protein
VFEPINPRFKHFGKSVRATEEHVGNNERATEEHVGTIRLHVHFKRVVPYSCDDQIDWRQQGAVDTGGGRVQWLTSRINATD